MNADIYGAMEPLRWYKYPIDFGICKQVYQDIIDDYEPTHHEYMEAMDIIMDGVSMHGVSMKDMELRISSCTCSHVITALLHMHVMLHYCWDSSSHGAWMRFVIRLRIHYGRTAKQMKAGVADFMVAHHDEILPLPASFIMEALMA